MTAGGWLRSRPRVCGTTQNVQCFSHPSITVTNALRRPAAGGRAVILTSGPSPVSSTGRPSRRTRSTSSATRAMAGEPNTRSTAGPALDGVLVELSHAAHDADDEIRPLGLEQTQLTELREHLVLGLFAYGAGVDEDEVGLGLVGGQLPAVLAQETGDPLGVILVHLTAVRDQMELGHSCLKNPAFALHSTVAPTVGQVKPQHVK